MPKIDDYHVNIEEFNNLKEQVAGLIDKLEQQESKILLTDCSFNQLVKEVIPVITFIRNTFRMKRDV